MTTPIRLDVDRKRVELDAGEGTRLHLRIRNTSDVVQHLRVEVRGLPDGARARAAPDLVQLLPAGIADVALDLELPATPLTDAGAHVLGVLAQSPHRVEISRCEEVRLEVPPRAALGLSVDPEQVRARTRARLTATATNTGNTPLTVTVRGSDPERRVQLQFQPPTLSLRPRESADVVVSASAPRAWTGPERRSPLTLTATAGAADVAATATATMVQAPFMSPAVLRSAGAAVAVLVLAGAFLARAFLAEDDPPVAADRAGVESTAEPTSSADTSPTPSASASASATAAPAPTEEATATTAPPAEVTAAPTATGTGALVPAPPRLETFDDDGGPEPRFVNGDTWRDKGFLVSALPVAGRVSDGCASATMLAAHGTGRSAHVTAAAAQSPTACNDTGLQVRFEDELVPVTDVALEVTEPGDYLVSTVAGDGERASRAIGVAGTSLLISVPSTQGLRSLALAADPAGARVPERVALQRIRFTPGTAAPQES